MAELIQQNIKRKVVFIGDSQVGKTSIINYKTEYQMMDRIQPTIGNNSQDIKIEIDSKEVKLQVWDTAGQEVFRSLVSVYLRGAQAAIIVYDLTREETFSLLNDW